MFRVKLSIDPELLGATRRRSGPGCPGSAMSASTPDVAWPDWLAPGRRAATAVKLDLRPVAALDGVAQRYGRVAALDGISPRHPGRAAWSG